MVDKIVEFFGPGLDSLSVADRATIGNMSPEYGATAGFFPVDEKTLSTCGSPGRSRRARGPGGALLPRSRALPRPRRGGAGVHRRSSSSILQRVETSLAGPKRPQDRIPLSKAKSSWREAVQARFAVRRERRRAWRSTSAGERETLRARRGGDCRHHELHQHLQPVRDDRRRAAGPEGGAARPACPGVREDQLRSRAPRWSRSTWTAPGSARTWRRWDSTWWATAARPASATRGRSTR